MANQTTLDSAQHRTKCDHKNHLQRQHRSLWQKLTGIKEVYICRQCGEKVIVK